MITKDLVEKINFYARKEKSMGLSKEEEEDRDILRKQYLKAFRSNLKSQLDNIKIVDEKEEKSE